MKLKNSKINLIQFLSFLILTIPCTSSLASAHLAMGIEAAKKENYQSAIKHFNNYSQENSTLSGTEEMRLKIWLGMSHIGLNHKSSDAYIHLKSALCLGLSTNHLKDISFDCHNNKRLSSIDKTDQDMLSAALAAIATQYWSEEKYSDSLNIYRIANEILLENAAADKSMKETSIQKKSVEKKQYDSLRGVLNHLMAEEKVSQQELQKNMMQVMFSGEKEAIKNLQSEKNPAIMRFKKIAQKKAMATAALIGKCHDTKNHDPNLLKKGLKGTSDEEMNLFVEQLIDLSAKPLSSDDCNISKTSTKIAKIKIQNNLFSQRTTDTFYRVGKKNMCPKGKVEKGSIMQTVTTQMADTFGSALEAKRGNQLVIYNLARPDFFNAYKSYISSADLLKQQQSKYKKRGKYRIRLSECGDRPKILFNMTTGIISALNRNTDDIAYYEEALGTLQFIQKRKKESTLGYATPMIEAHRALAEKYLQNGQAQKGLQELRKALAIIHEAKPDDRELSMTAWLKVLNPTSKTLTKLGKPLTEVNEALDIIISKQSSIAQRALKYAKMDYAERLKFDSEEKIDNLDINKLTQNIDMQKMMAAAAEKQGIKLPEKTLKEADVKGAEIMASLQQLLSASNLKEKLTSENSDFQEITNKILENSDASLDMSGTRVEKIRSTANDIKMFELAVAEVYLTNGDLKKTELWINHNKEGDNSYKYTPRTLAFDAYVKARYYAASNQATKAQYFYSMAIQYWYSNPIGAMDAIVTTFPTNTFLLESAAEYELQQGNTKRSLRYIELARHANIGNPKLYGFINQEELKRLQTKLEHEYKELESTARNIAKNKQQITAFDTALAESRSRRMKSSRSLITPLMPMFTGLDPLIPWLKPDKLHPFLFRLEQFNDLWSNQNLSMHRKNILIAAMEKISLNNQSTEPMYNDPEEDEDIFRTARPNKDSVIANNKPYPNSSRVRSDLPSINALQPLLENNVSVLSFWLTPKSLFIYSIDRSSIHSITLESDVAMTLIKQLKSNYSEENAIKLHTQLIAPFENSLNKRVILLVNGALKNIPFVALKDASSRQFFGESHVISYSPSFGDIFQSRTTSGTSENTLLVLAPTNIESQADLPYAREESQILKKYFSTKTYRDDEVTKSLLTHTLPKYKMVHFAGHASLNDDLPDFSRLILAQDSNKQSSFYIDDIKSLDLSGLELVVLSACESASTNDYNLNNEFSALNSAFISAGANSVIASLHVVRDSVTLALMDQFYQQLANGKEKDYALQYAQHYIRNNVSDDPRDWAAFILSGSNNAVKL